jgi:hypothetical protein
MNCNSSIITNMGGIVYLSTTNTTVGTEAVDFALGFIRRPLPPVGYFTVRITSAIPSGTTGTLPVTLTLNGTTRQLTKIDGTAVTAAELPATGVFQVFNDRFNGILQIMSPVAATA